MKLMTYIFDHNKVFIYFHGQYHLDDEGNLQHSSPNHSIRNFEKDVYE